MNGSVLIASLCLGFAVALGGRPSRLADRPVGQPRTGLAVVAAVGIVAAGVLSLGLFPVTAVLTALLVIFATRSRRRRTSRRREVERDVVAVCVDLAAELSVGRSPRDALGAVAAAPRPCSRVLSQVVAVEALGGGLPDAWRRAAQVEPGMAALRDVAVCWEVALRTGASLASTVTEVARGMADQLARREQVSARLAGAQSTTRLLAVLPLGGLAMGWSLGTDPLGFLFGTGWGRLAMTVAVALELLGLRWGRAISERAHRS